MGLRQSHRVRQADQRVIGHNEAFLLREGDCAVELGRAHVLNHILHDTCGLLRGKR
jgi:hypothetical protein